MRVVVDTLSWGCRSVRQPLQVPAEEGSLGYHPSWSRPLWVSHWSQWWSRSATEHLPNASGVTVRCTSLFTTQPTTHSSSDQTYTLTISRYRHYPSARPSKHVTGWRVIVRNTALPHTVSLCLNLARAVCYNIVMNLTSIGSYLPVLFMSLMRSSQLLYRSIYRYYILYNLGYQDLFLCCYRYKLFSRQDQLEQLPVKSQSSPVRELAAVNIIAFSGCYNSPDMTLQYPSIYARFEEQK